MEHSVVRDLMVPLDEYAVVSIDATLADAVRALDEAQARLPEGRQPHRAVLVTDHNGTIVGKIGQLAFLKGLEPKYNMMGEFDRMSRAGVSDELMSTMRNHFQLFEDPINDICERGATVPVRDVMHPVKESVAESATLTEALHHFVVWQQLSLLVTAGGKVTGLLRLSDLFEVFAKRIGTLGDR
ncbi:CBS domain-containing protein [candidate division GN15 bacterium]|nr:CBS domain-containing protein [candidate division GN15 bacterium]